MYRSYIVSDMLLSTRTYTLCIFEKYVNNSLLVFFLYKRLTNFDYRIDFLGQHSE